MPLQQSVNGILQYKAETTIGTLPGTTGGQRLRRVSSSLAVNKDSFSSNEVRSDAQVADVRHGGRSVRGNIEGELSTATWDDWLAALLRGSWVAGVSAGPADFATGVTPANGGGTFTFAGAGNLITKGFKIGDIVRCTGMTTNNNINYRITALTATVMTVFPAPQTTAQVVSGWTVAVVGNKLNCGTVLTSFMIEQSYPDLDISELFNGCRIGGANINVPPNGIGTIQWDVMGLNGSVATGAGAPYLTAPTGETTTGVLTGIEGALRMNGVEQAIVTGLQLNITNNLSVQPVIGSVQPPDIFYGRTVVTGNVSAFLADELLLNAFLNESNIDIVAVCAASGAAPQAFLNFNMQNVKFTGIQKTMGGEGGIIAQYTFQAILKAGGAGTTFDQSTLVVQRSN